MKVKLGVLAKKLEGPVKSHESDNTLAEGGQGMAEDEAQRGRWTFCEVVNLRKLRFKIPSP